MFGPRPLYKIAASVKEDWKNVSPYAKPYLAAMAELNHVNEMYYADSAKSVVLYFLANTGSWRGEVAKRVKAELKAMVK